MFLVPADMCCSGVAHLGLDALPPELTADSIARKVIKESTSKLQCQILEFALRAGATEEERLSLLGTPIASAVILEVDEQPMNFLCCAAEFNYNLFALHFLPIHLPKHLIRRDLGRGCAVRKYQMESIASDIDSVFRCAIRGGRSIPLIRYLLSGNQVTRPSQTAINQATEAAAEAGNPKALRLLLACSTPPPQTVITQAKIAAARARNVETLRLLFARRPTPPSPNGITQATTAAAEAGNAEALRLLLAHSLHLFLQTLD